MNFKFLLFLVAAVGAASIQEHQAQSQQQQRQRQTTEVIDPSEDGPVGYDFSYSVQDPTTGDIKSQEESRRNGNVRGQYSWVDADGVRQIVDYQADDQNGFQSEHRREPAILRSRPHHIVQIIPAPLYAINTLLAPVQSSVSRVDHRRRQQQENRDGRDNRRDDGDNRDDRENREDRDDRDDRDNRNGRDDRDNREGQNRSRDQDEGRRGRDGIAQSEVRFQDPAVSYQYSNWTRTKEYARQWIFVLDDGWAIKTLKYSLSCKSK